MCHPGPTVGYRLEADGTSLAYMPDHEPALGARDFPGPRGDIPGLALADGVDLLIHDAMFSEAEYPRYVGWGHSSIDQTLAFAGAARVRRLVPFHHDPSHTDAELDRMLERAAAVPHAFELLPGLEGATYEIQPRGR